MQLDLPVSEREPSERRPETSGLPLFRSPPLDFVESSPGFHRGPSSRKGLRLVAWSVAACAMDSLLVCGAILLAFAIVALTLHLPLRQFSFLLGAPLFLTLLIVATYQITLRLFIGQTLGEWACGIRLARKLSGDQFSLRPPHASHFVLRTFWIVVTGLVVLPVLSLVMGRDLAGNLSGLVFVSTQSEP